MANLLSWLGDQGKRIKAQIDPFDGGATYANPNPAPRPATPQQRQQQQAARSNTAVSRVIPTIENLTKAATNPIGFTMNEIVRNAGKLKVPGSDISLKEVADHVPEAAGKIAIGGRDLGVGVARGIAKTPETLVRSISQPLAEVLEPGATTSTGAPTDPIRKFLYGDDPIKTYIDQGKDVSKFIEEKTGDKNLASYGIFAGPVLAALDLTPGGGAKNEVVEQLAKAGGREAVEKVLKEGGIKAGDDIIEQLAKTTDKKEVVSLLKSGAEKATEAAQATKTAVGGIQPSSMPTIPTGAPNVPRPSGPIAMDPIDPVVREAQDVIENTRQFHPEFNSKVDNIAKTLGEKGYTGPPKKADRVAEKAINDYGGDISQVRDIVRGTVHLSNPGSLDNHLAEIGKNYEITRVKNGLNAAGYKDVKVNVRLPNGREGEILLASPEMLEAKHALGGHKLYEASRGAEVPNEVRQALENEMNRLYSAADEAAARRLASSADTSVPSTSALPTENGLPVETTVPRVTDPSSSSITSTPSTSKNLVADSIDESPSPASIPQGSKEYKFIETARDSKNTAPEVAAKIKGDAPSIANKETLAQADAEINKRGFENAVTHVKNTTDGETLNQAMALRLVDELQGLGRYDDAVEVIEKTAERARATGQATQILAAYNRLSPEGILRYAQRTIDQAKIENPKRFGNLKLSSESAEKLRLLSEKVQGLPDGIEKNMATREMLTEIEKLVPTPAMTKAVTLWKAGLLTGIKGQLGNQVGNSSHMMLRKLADVPASGIDAAIATITGNRSKTFTMKGLLEGGAIGLGKSKDIVTKGYDPTDLALTKYDIKKTFFSDSPLGKAAQAYSDTVFNLTGAGDKPYFYATLQNNLYDLGKTEAKNAKLSGSKAKEFVDNFVKNPPEDALLTANNAATESVFANDNAIGAALKGLKNGLKTKGGAVGELVAEVNVPFTGVPSAIATEVINYSPAGAVKSIYKAIKDSRGGAGLSQSSQRALSEGLGKAITGTAGLWLGAELTKSGQMTLGWPKDKKERELWEAEGKQPYSIQIGGKWRSLNYSGPIGAVLAAGGQIIQSGKDGASLGETAQSTAQQAAATVVQQSPLRGVQQGLDFITDPEGEGKRYIPNLAGSTIPTLVKDMAQATDLDNQGKSKKREVNGVTDAVVDRIPFARKSLLEDRDAFGRAKNTGKGPLTTIFDPFKSTDAKTGDEMTKELRRLYDAGPKEFGTMPSELEKKLTLGGEELELTPQQLDTYKQFVGAQTEDAWRKIIASPEYQELPDDKKKKALDNAVEDIRAAGKIKFVESAGIEGGNIEKAKDELSARAAQTSDGKLDTGDYTLEKATRKSNPRKYYEDQVKQYLKDKKDMSAVERSKKELELSKLSITSKYSNDVYDLYSMSKANRTAILEQNPELQSLMPDVAKLSAELKNRKFATTDKISSSGKKGGKGGKGGKAAKFKAPDISQILALNKSGMKIASTGSKFKAPKIKKKTAKFKAPKISKAKVSKTPSIPKVKSA